MDEDLLRTLKALSDASRLRIVGLLAARPHAVEELAGALDLSAATVVHHLKRLRAAGLVEARPNPPYVEYTLRLYRLQAVGRRLHELESGGEPGSRLPGPDGQELPAYDARVLRAFIVGGRLASIPARDKKRGVVLRYLAERVFDEPRDYPEREVNERLATFHEDVATLRRALVDARLVVRSGGRYRRVVA